MAHFTKKETEADHSNGLVEKTDQNRVDPGNIGGWLRN